MSDQKYLTIVRTFDGRMVPHIDGKPIAGCVDLVVDGGQRVTQITFLSASLIFDIEKASENRTVH